MPKRLKNTTGSDIIHSGTGINLAPGQYEDISELDAVAMSDDELKGSFNTNSILYNDGAVDYEGIEGFARFSGGQLFSFYAFSASAPANAGVGNYLNFFPSIDSLTVPYVFPRPGNIVSVYVGIGSVATTTFGFFKTSDLNNPVFSISMTNEKTKLVTGISYLFGTNDQLAIRVTSGSSNKPSIMLWVN